uniref:NAD(P)H-hydrate epimerase n=1 Tax=Arcella intermedia TaxID=1963864 RepID=A0A6B2LF54_9EUKA
MSIKYINQIEAKLIDEELMNADLGFNNDILMELAGLSCAQVIFEAYPLAKYPKVLVILGPGNNGGDGLVCARHLTHFGYRVSCFYPRFKEVHPFAGLRKQCVHLNIPFAEVLPDLKECDLIVDAIFGYSFTGDIRPPFNDIINKLKETSTPIASLDIPSGWDVEKGNQHNKAFQPDTLISLTAPKQGAAHFAGRFHYLGGRFVPPAIAHKYHLNLPDFPGSAQFVLLPNL